MKALTTALIQQSCSSDYQQNLSKTVQLIENAKQNGAELVLLQELHTNLYFCQEEKTNFFDLAETIPGPTTHLLSNVAKKLEIVIVASIFEKRAKGLFHNTAVVIEKNGEIAGIYRKMHIPDDPGFYEKFYFTPGDLGFKPIATSVGNLGVLVCWDQWFPEAARLMALAGADLLLYPTAIGWDPTDTQEEKARQLDAWFTVQRGHAIANGLPVLVSNRIGFEKNPDHSEKGIQFWGTSFVAGPQGEIIAKASDSKEEIVLASVNMARSEQARRIWPFLRDRRIDEYQGLLKRYLK